VGTRLDALLEDVEVACFDLFDTLIRVDRERLPAVPWEGGELRSTLPILHARHLEARGVSFDALLRELRALWEQVRGEQRREDLPEDRRFREVPAVEKFRRLLERLGVAPDPAAREELAEALAATHHGALVECAEALPGAEEVLAAARARGARTALVSNWDHARAGPAMLEHTGLAPLLDHVVISETVGFRKPHPRIFEAALAPFGASPQRALHVGDLAASDVHGAGRLGFRTVWINPSGRRWAQEGPPPTATVPGLADLLEPEPGA